MIREGEGLTKMAKELTLRAKKVGVQVAIGTEQRYARSKRLVVIAKSAKEMEKAQKFLIK